MIPMIDEERKKEKGMASMLRVLRIYLRTNTVKEQAKIGFSSYVPL